MVWLFNHWSRSSHPKFFVSLSCSRWTGLLDHAYFIRHYAGHNKWSKIHREKAIVDRKKSQRLAAISKDIISSIKANGSDPALNQRLANALERARTSDVPKKVVDHAIQKGLGRVGGENGQFVLYECQGPCNVSLIISAITDNKNRTYMDIKSILHDYGGSIGEPGSVMWKFEKKGRIDFSFLNPEEEKDLTPLLDLAIELNCDDFKEVDGQAVQIYCPFSLLGHFRKQIVELAPKPIEILVCEQAYLPIEGYRQLGSEADVAEERELIESCIEELQSLDCVEHVHTDVQIQ